jgi:predicted nucleic-acid-binding protein
MSSLVETSVVVRYLVQDQPQMAQRAAEIIEGPDDLVVTDVVLLETAHVLRSVYNVARDLIVDTLVAFVSRRNIAVLGLEKDLVLQALLLCRPSGRVSFGDALVWAAARSSRIEAVFSFDERFPGDSIEVRR